MRSELRRFFDRAAPEWATRRVDAHQVEDLLDRIGLKNGWRVVDLGGGTGHLLEFLRRRIGPAGRLLSMDLSPAMLRLACAAARGAQALRCAGTAEAPPLRAGQWDAVLGMGLYPHLRDPAEALAQIRALLSPHGVVAFFHLIGRAHLNRLHAQIGGPVGHHQLPPVSQVAAQMRRSGFRITCALDAPDRYLVAGRRVDDPTCTA